MLNKIVVGNEINTLPGFPFNSQLFTNEDGMQLIRIRDLLTHSSDTNYVGPFSPNYIVRKGDILIGMDGDFHIVKWSGSPGLLNQRILKIYNKKGSAVDINYLFYRLQPLLLEINDKTAATTVKHLSTYDISELEIEVPSVLQQRKIAKILSTVDDQIEKVGAIIAKYQAIKQGMLHDLFTRGIDMATGALRSSYQDAPDLYKNSPLGVIPKEWNVERLGAMTEKIGSGVTPTGGSEVYRSEGILFIRSQNVLVNELSLHDAAFISKEIDNKMAASRVQPYDVLLNITGASIGRSAYFPKELILANVNQHVCIIRFHKKSKEMALFASAYVNSPFGQIQIHKLNAGGNREGLNYQQIRSFYFPEIDTQELEMISERIATIFNLIKKERLNLEKLLLLKQGLMSDLLSGNVEVNIKEQVSEKHIK